MDPREKEAAKRDGKIISKPESGSQAAREAEPFREPPPGFQVNSPQSGGSGTAFREGGGPNVPLNDLTALLGQFAAVITENLRRDRAAERAEAAAEFERRREQQRALAALSPSAAEPSDRPGLGLNTGGRVTRRQKALLQHGGDDDAGVAMFGDGGFDLMAASPPSPSGAVQGAEEEGIDAEEEEIAEDSDEVGELSGGEGKDKAKNDKNDKAPKADKNNKSNKNDKKDKVGFSDAVKKRRRESFLQRVDSRPTATIQYTAPLPSYKHIALETLNVREVRRFTDDVVEYRTTHGLHCPAASLIKPAVRDQIIARTKGKLTAEEFYALEVRELILLLLEQVRPDTVLAFQKMLEYNVQFPTLPKDYKPRSDNFQPMYDALLLYRKNFETVYEILAEENEANIPAATYKDGGLVKIFANKIPFDYCHKFLRADGTTKFTSIKVFIRRFYEERVEVHYESFKVARNMNQNFDVSTLSKAAQAFKSSKDNAATPSRFQKGSGYRSGGNYSGTHRVQHVQQADEQNDSADEDSDVDGYPSARKLNAEDGYDGTSGAVNDDAYADVEEDESSMTETELKSAAPLPPEDDVEAQLQALAALNAAASTRAGGAGAGKDGKPNVPNGCFGMLFYDKCSRPGKCSYSHEHSVLAKSYSYYMKLLLESKYKPSGAPGVTGIQRRPPPPPPGGGKLHHMSVCFDSQDAVDRFINPVLHDALQTEVLRAMPEASLYSAMHCPGLIRLPDRTTVPLPKAMFDSGALHGSYIAKSFVDEHRDDFDAMIRPCNIRVTLADDETVHRIQEIVRLVVQFEDSTGKTHKGSVDFCVFDMKGNDVIIGLPDIAASFPDFFKSLVDNAVSMVMQRLNTIGSSLQHIEGHNPQPVEKQALEQTDDLRIPWSATPEVEAPEDLATELPCSFTAVLKFMEVPYEQALQEYLDMIPTHVSKEFLDATHVEQLLINKGKLVFVPDSWGGIKGVAPLELDWKEEALPKRLKPRARPINPKLYEHALKEFNRLKGYIYEDSTSEIASCLVIAPKATPPFIRFCGDYGEINKYIAIGHYPIPHVQRSLEKIRQYEIYIDMDMANSFHQIILAARTSRRLSIQTPWGQVQPKFMPEGVGPASGILQKIVNDIFGEFDWCIAIFDNLLVLAHDYEDAYRKTEIILDRCIERNVILKFSKSWLGMREVKFFGYVCRKGSYELGDDRKAALKAIPFPQTKKQMQSFLGAALFFKSFIPNYSVLTAPLTDMIREGFKWDESTWTVDYRAIFESFKDTLQHATAIFYPDYEKKWILRTDASLRGIGAVLSQEHITPEGEVQLQPIGFMSEKFSDQAVNWNTFEQESYGVYAGVKYFSYYLRCKPFILETDHNNLRWMEASVVPKVIRWRAYLQSFSFLLRHIPGKQNLVADFLSRCHGNAPQSADSTSLSMMVAVLSGTASSEDTVPQSLVAVPAAVTQESEAATEVVDIPRHQPEELLRKVHGGRMGHNGARVTWKLLNDHFPGVHRIPYRVVQEFVANCAVCQKDRLGMVDTLEPVVRHLKPEHQRSMVGVDTLTITPPDKYGNQYLHVIVNHFTKLTVLFAATENTALAVATALFQFCCSYGLFDSLISDPGSEFNNDVIKQLTAWFGIRHVFSLVDRHESNGVEGTNKQILKHLKALVMDERVKDAWSSPTVLPLVQFIINNHQNSETGLVPFHAHFGSANATYFRMPAEGGDSMQRAHAYIQLLDNNLRVMRDISKRHQADIVAKRAANSPAPDKQNIFQPGDLVLFQLNPDNPLPTKLTPKFRGPYEVIEQQKNDVRCRHIILGDVKEFHVTRLKLFTGSREEALRVAMIDNDQFTVVSLAAYRGDPLTRTTMEFEVHFADGTVVWLPWTKDLSDTVQFEEFCRSRPELAPLLYSAKDAADRVKQINRTAITEIQPGDTVYVDLRSYGATWYSSLPLPDKDHTRYVVQYRYGEFSNRGRTKIKASCPLFNEKWVLDHDFVRRYGAVREIAPAEDNKIVVIDDEMLAKYPELLR
jgi:hypothetical protein